MSDEANRLEAIFTAALAKPTREARAAYLDEAVPRMPSCGSVFLVCSRPTTRPAAS